jgi:hypothetical protein
MSAVKPPSGRDIWQAVRTEMAANLYTLPFSRVVPAVYHVYLHPDDFETIEGLVARIVGDVEKAIAQEIQRLNGDQAPRTGLRGMLRKRTDEPPIETPEKIEIFIQPDEDGELRRGSLGIVSRLLVPAANEFLGPATVRTVKTVVADGRRTATIVDAAAPRRATLAYRDDVGEQRVPILKDLVKIGRGGSGAWADIQVFSTPKVSREHCWIIREADGRFFIRDVSVWGTSVNGRPLPPAERTTDGKVSAPGAQSELPPTARIQLADALEIDFSVEASS